MLMIAGRWTIHDYKMQTSEKYFDYHQFTIRRTYTLRH